MHGGAKVASVGLGLQTESASRKVADDGAIPVKLENLPNGVEQNLIDFLQHYHYYIYR